MTTFKANSQISIDANNNIIFESESNSRNNQNNQFVLSAMDMNLNPRADTILRCNHKENVFLGAVTTQGERFWYISRINNGAPDSLLLGRDVPWNFIGKVFIFNSDTTKVEVVVVGVADSSNRDTIHLRMEDVYINVTLDLTGNCRYGRNIEAISTVSAVKYDWISPYQQQGAVISANNHGGNYEVITQTLYPSDGYTCKDTTSIYLSRCLGMSQAGSGYSFSTLGNNLSLSLSPNPAKETIEISSNSDFYEIYHISGVMAQKGFGKTIDITNLETGMYVLKSGKESAKFMKKQ